MKLTWIGHSCFKIENNGYSIVTDPYSDGAVPGLAPVRETANAVYCSHDHRDHNAADLVCIEETDAVPFSVKKLDTYHDEAGGTKRGTNVMHIFETGGKKIAHLGDLGCEPEPEQIEALKGMDVVCIPVGGFYTIDGRQAADLIGKIQPRVVIPMHYRDAKEGFGYEQIGEIGEFVSCLDNFKMTGVSELEITDDMQGVIVMRPKNVVK